MAETAFSRSVAIFTAGTGSLPPTGKGYSRVMTETVYTVTGMTCDHCAKSVTEEVGKIEGVESVSVDLPTGAVTVVSATAVSDEAIRAAVDEAGYQVA